MSVTQQPLGRRWRASTTNLWLLAVIGVLAAALVVVVASNGDETSGSSTTRGSGHSVTVQRAVAPFTAVELAGANLVVVEAGTTQSVAVTGDDNLVDRVTTVVRDGRLVIDDTGSFTTKAPMRVAVTVPTLDRVELSGDGTVSVTGVAGDVFSAELTGDGTLLASGVSRRVTGVLEGDGTLDLHSLVATDGVARLDGTGTIRVHATATLEATLTGTGTILYGGDPTVTMRNTGTGTVTAE